MHPSRHVSLSAQPNFRDLGGYETTSGRRVKWGLVYRSGELSRLTDGDVGKLEDLGIATVVDLRSPEEVSARGKGRLPPRARAVPVPITTGDLFSKLIPMFLRGDFSQLPPDLPKQINRVLVRDCGAQFGTLLRTILDPSNRPLVFHCTQGKDRAGFGAAMLLSALGVPWETVIEDYLLSNHFRKEDNARILGLIRTIPADRLGEDIELKVQGLLTVSAASLEAAHAEIWTLHGDLSSFLSHGLGLHAEEIERLRDDLLE